jgi:precorrin-6x reductase
MTNTQIIITIAVSVVLNIVLLYGVRNLLKKNEQQEDVLARYLDYMDSLSKTIEYIDEKLKKIDLKGTFQSDDEIGWFFREVQGMLFKLLNFKLIDEKDDREKSEEEKV